MSYLLFPRHEYLDGDLSDEEVARLDRALVGYARTSPVELTATGVKMSGVRPKEWYEGFVSALDQVVAYFAREMEAEVAVPYPALRAKLAAVWGTALAGWMEFKKAESVFKGIK